MQSLDIEGNQITELPKAIGQLKQLRSLVLGELWGNQLSALPEEIGKLAQLRSLKVSKNQLSVLPEEIGELTVLQRLDLSDNQLSALPEAIGQLSALQQLDLSGNQLSALPEEIGQLTALQQLDLSGNRLSALPEAIGQLTALQVLNFSGNQLSALPEAIGRLTALQVLNLSTNQLSPLPQAIGRLTALEWLDLSENLLSELPEAIRQLMGLRQLFLHGNNALAIPPDALGPTAIEVSRDKKEPAKAADIVAFYFRSRTEATRPLHEAKILIVGQGAVGKTSLVRALRNEPFDAHEPKTEGINIAEWLVPLAANGEDGSIKVNIWDFGGQEIMHATHQFFLTTRSLYLVVIDARKGEDEGRLHYWLKIVQSYGADSPIAVVINKHEDPNYLDLNENWLRQDYTPNIQAFFKTSCERGAGIVELREWLEQAIRTLPHVADPMPISFFNLKRDLEERNVNYLTFTQYQEACIAHGVDGKSEQASFLRILHALGSVLNFDDRGARSKSFGTRTCSTPAGSPMVYIVSSTIKNWRSPAASWT